MKNDERKKQEPTDTAETAPRHPFALSSSLAPRKWTERERGGKGGRYSTRGIGVFSRAIFVARLDGGRKNRRPVAFCRDDGTIITDGRSDRRARQRDNTKDNSKFFFLKMENTDRQEDKV